MWSRDNLPGGSGRLPQVAGSRPRVDCGRAANLKVTTTSANPWAKLPLGRRRDAERPTMQHDDVAARGSRIPTVLAWSSLALNLALVAGVVVLSPLAYPTEWWTSDLDEGQIQCQR